VAGFLASLGRLVAGPAGLAGVLIALFSALVLAPAPLPASLSPASLSPADLQLAGLLPALAASGGAVLAGRALEERLRGDGLWLRLMILLVPVLAVTSGGPGRLRRLGLDQPVETPVIALAAALGAILTTMALLRLARRAGGPRIWALISAGLAGFLFALAALSHVPALALAPGITGSRAFLAATTVCAVTPLALVSLSGIAARGGRIGVRRLPPRR